MEAAQNHLDWEGLIDARYNPRKLNEKLSQRIELRIQFEIASQFLDSIVV